MKKVIITGADGFIGSNLIKRLVQDNVEVWAVIHPNSTTKERIESIKEVHCIESTIECLADRISELPQNADVFFHLAWQGVDALTRDNFFLQTKNIELGLESMRVASLLGVGKFVLPGSTSEYLYYGKPIDANAVPSPLNAYGSAKVALRYLAEQYSKQLKLNFVYVVITGIYAEDRRDNNVIFYTINCLLKSEKPSLTKLEQMWNYVHISDVVNALILIGKKGKPNGFYAIGSDENQPLYEYINIIHEYINPLIPLGIGEIPYMSDKLPSSCINLSELYKDTGYIPKVKFQDGIKQVIDFIENEM